MRTTLAFLAAFFLLLRPAVPAEELVFEAGPSQNSLVQLFTSDANASCNPALDWMSAQKDKDPKSDLWVRFVPVAMHVKHWDAMGYKDAFAKAEFEDMLTAYQKAWSASNAYPPTVAADGVEWSGWSRGQEVPSVRDRQTGTLTVHSSFEQPGIGKFSADFKASKLLQSEPLTLHACLLSFGLSSKPSEGKNRGRSLKHDFIATFYRRQDFRSVRSGLEASVEIAVPKVRTLRSRYAMVFWVTKKDSVLPVQAAGGFLPET